MEPRCGAQGRSGLRDHQDDPHGRKLAPGQKHQRRYGLRGSASKPIPLTKEEIDQLGIDRQVIEVNFKPGDTVKVTDGAFEGFTGVIDEVDVDKQRLTVIVTMFGRETPINLEFDEAEVVKD